MRVTRRVLVNVAMFAVAFAVMVGWAVNQVVSVDQLDRPYDVSAEFANAFGVVANAEVTYLGVGLGSVRSVDRVPTGVRVNMQIERGRQIPAAATAMVSRKSAIGEPYVDFSPPAGYEGGGPYLAAGDVVPRERTAVPLEFSELLRSASALVESIPPEDVATLVDEAAAALEGNGQALADLAHAGDQLTATFAARTEALDRLATNNTRLTRVVTEHRGSLGASVSDLRQVAASLRSASGDSSLLLDRGSRLLAEAATLVANQKGTIDCILGGVELVIDETTTPQRLRELDALLAIGPTAFDGLWQARDVEADGPWIRVGNVVNNERPPQQYVPPRQLPAVPAVGQCQSQLVAYAGTYRTGEPITAGRDKDGALPATGAPAAIGVAAAAVLIIAVGIRGRPGRRRAR